jgi:hypothetical protein
LIESEARSHALDVTRRGGPLRWKLAVGSVAFMMAPACVTPPPKDLSNSFTVTYSATFMTSTAVAGTVTNTGPTPADYSVEVSASSGETASYTALDVLAGQTAVWFIGLEGRVAVSQTRVTSSATIASPVPAVATITRYHDQVIATLAQGTVTNTGSSTASFDIELQASSGAVAIASVNDVQPGQTVEWSRSYAGRGTARVVRITTVHASP